MKNIGRIENLLGNPTKFGSYITSRVANTNDKHAFVFVTSKVFVVMGVRDLALELVQSWKIWDVFVCMMSSTDQYCVKHFGRLFIFIFYLNFPFSIRTGFNRKDLKQLKYHYFI